MGQGALAPRVLDGRAALLAVALVAALAQVFDPLLNGRVRLPLTTPLCPARQPLRGLFPARPGGTGHIDSKVS